MSYQFTFLGRADIPEEMALAEEAAAKYPWKTIRAALEPPFRKAATEFHARTASQSQADTPEPPLLELMDFNAAQHLPIPEREFTMAGKIIEFFRHRNPKGAGRNPQPFLAYLKAFQLAPILYIAPDSTRIAESLSTNPFFLGLCGFS